MEKDPHFPSLLTMLPTQQLTLATSMEAEPTQQVTLATSMEALTQLQTLATSMEAEPTPQLLISSINEIYLKEVSPTYFINKSSSILENPLFYFYTFSIFFFMKLQLYF